MSFTHAPAALIDTHAHLSSPSFGEDALPALARAKAAGVVTVLDVGTEPEEWELSLALAASAPDVHCILGLHPNSAAAWTPEMEAELRELIADPRVVAVGETGLDWYRLGAPAEVQRSVFIAHLGIARDAGLPVSIHARDSYDDVLSVLEEHRQGVVAVMHSFGGDVEHALRAVGLGCYISISGPVTYKNGGNVREVAAAVPSTACSWRPTARTSRHTRTGASETSRRTWRSPPKP
ncbi:MAG: TatD family hydrolase [Chloroflexia bacterium]